MSSVNTVNKKSATVSFFLCLFLGTFGAHRFYVGKMGTGVLMLLTGGGLGIWTLIDLGNLVCNNFQDGNSNTLELTQNPSFFKKIMMVIGSVIAEIFILLIFIGVMASIFSNPISLAVNRQLDSLRSGNMQAAYSYNSSDFQKVTSLDAYSDFVKQHPILKNFEFRSSINIKMTEDKGAAEITLKTSDSDTPVSYQLIKEDNTWKIQAMEVGKTVPADNALITVKTSVEINN